MIIKFHYIDTLLINGQNFTNVNSFFPTYCTIYRLYYLICITYAYMCTNVH